MTNLQVPGSLISHTGEAASLTSRKAGKYTNGSIIYTNKHFPVKKFVKRKQFIQPTFYSIYRSQHPRNHERVVKFIPESNGDTVSGLSRLLPKLQITYSIKYLAWSERRGQDIEVALGNLLKKPFWIPRPVEWDPVQNLLKRHGR